MSENTHAMRRRQLLLITTFTTVLMAGTTGLLSDRLIEQRKYIDHQARVVARLSNELQGERLLNKELQREIRLLEDSIALLQREKAELSKQLSTARREVRRLRDELHLVQQKVAALEVEINTLSRARDQYQARIEQMEIEKKQLLDSLAWLQRRRVQAEETEATQRQAQQAAEEEAARLERIRQVVLRTAVQWDEVVLSKKDESGALSHIRPGTDQWRFTKVTFSLGHPNPELLFGQTFVLQIVDQDTGKPLPYLEVNPSFPDSPHNTTGVRFVFSNNPVTLTYRNDMVKESRNYELQLYLESGGRQYRLVHGVRPLVRQGKVVSR